MKKTATNMIEQPQPLSPLLAKRLVAYAAMAGAAVVAYTCNAAAEVVYTPIQRNLDQHYQLDLNNDGIADFHFHSSSLSGFGHLEVFPSVTGNKIVAVHQHCYFSSMAAGALISGAEIGPDTPQLAQANCMAGEVETSVNGPWLGAKDRYLGFSFLISGKKHYGWARLSMQVFGCYGCIGKLLGYAYETIPGKPIIAGDEGSSSETSAQPVTLGALAAGAPAFNSWRKEETKP
jgi:hypothetical protein